MTLVPSLLQAIVIMDGEALVLHVGERPYVVTDGGQVTISNAALTPAAVDDVLAELLPADSRRALDEHGATQCELPATAEVPAERFAVVAARGGDDVWVEIRRITNQPSTASALRVETPVVDRPEPARPVPAPPPPALVAPVVAAPVPTPPPPVSPIAGVPRVEVPSASPEPRRQEPVVSAPAPARPVEAAPAVVVPMTAPSMRSVAATQAVSLAPLEQLLRQASAKGASALYLVAGSAPVVRVDGDIRPLEGTVTLSSFDVESWLLSLAIEVGVTSLTQPREFVVERDGLGGVRVRTFADARGAGGILRLAPRRALTLQELGLPRELLAATSERDGVVLVAGRRGHGRRTLLSALIDHVNRSCPAHIASIARELSVLHERHQGLVTQVEVPDSSAVPDAIRRVLADDPDVLVIDAVHSDETLDLVLDASASGRLVICGVVAPSVTVAIESWLELVQPVRRRQVQVRLARHLRAAVGQVLVQTPSGGRAAARELLLKSPAVTALLTDGRTAELPLVLDASRRQGMIGLNDALLALVQAGAVEPAAACDASPDADALLGQLRRFGVDVSAAERRA